MTPTTPKNLVFQEPLIFQNYFLFPENPGTVAHHTLDIPVDSCYFTHMTTDTLSMLPNWLEQLPQPSLSPSSQLQPAHPAHPIPTGNPAKELMEMIFENLFERALEKIVMGQPLTQIIREDPRDIDIPKFMRWIHKDPQRQQRYLEAREIGGEMVADELLAIADAVDDPMEDVQRSTLRISTRKWLLAVWNRKRYGETKQLDITSTHQISIVQALEQARERVITGTTYDQLSDS